MNRSVCSLMQHEYKEAICDCDTVLDMIQAESDAEFQALQAGEAAAETVMTVKALNREQQRGKMLVRRGSAKVWSKDLSGGLVDYNSALEVLGRYSEGGLALTKDIEKIRERLSLSESL